MVETNITKNHPIVFFMPCSGIYNFSRSISIFADAVQRAGTPAFIVSCNGQLTRCPMMDMYRLPVKHSMAQKKVLCAICKKYSGALSRRYNTKLLPIGDFIKDTDREIIESLLREHKGKLINLEYQGHKIGKQAFYDLSIITKNGDTESEDQDRGILFRDYIRTTLEGMFAAKRIIETYQPVSFVVFEIYGLLQGVGNSCLDMETKNLSFTPTTFMGQNMGEFVFWSHSRLFCHRFPIQLWSILRSIPLPPKAVYDSWNDAYFRSHGSNTHIYSKPKGQDPQTIVEQLNLSPNRKTIVAYPSSPDENNALAAIEEARGGSFDIKELFSDQFIWLQELVKFCTPRDDLQLVIRLHPRLGVDRRSGIASPALEKFREDLSNLPPHCHVLWPEDPISSYDLAELADVGLISWSTMGKELMRIGVPTMSCVENFYYVDDDCMRIPKSRNDYFEQLDALLQTPYHLETLARAIRFVHAGLRLPAIDLRPSVPQTMPNSPFLENPIPRVADEQIALVRDILIGNIDLPSSNITALPTSVSDDSAEKEMQAIREGIGHFIESTYCPPIHETKTSRLSKIKASIPPFLKPVLRLALDSWLQWKQPPLRATEVSYPGWDKNRRLVCVCGFSDEARHIAETIKDPNLRVLEVDGEKTRYIHHGLVISRTSRLISRLAQLLMPLQDQG